MNCPLAVIRDEIPSLVPRERHQHPGVLVSTPSAQAPDASVGVLGLRTLTLIPTSPVLLTLGTAGPQLGE